MSLLVGGRAIPDAEISYATGREDPPGNETIPESDGARDLIQLQRLGGGIDAVLNILSIKTTTY